MREKKGTGGRGKGVDEEEREGLDSVPFQKFLRATMPVD